MGGRDDCYPCAVARARIAVLKGDRSAAIGLFRHATGLGPSLPEAWQENGVGLGWAGAMWGRGWRFSRRIVWGRAGPIH